ncbi:sterile alpha motif domain-containing protein 9-like isoform 1-T4 [Salvelinus alpinus]
MENEEEGKPADLPDEIKDWNKHHVKQWALNEACVDVEFADILLQQNINGPSLLLLEKSDLLEVGVTLGPAKLIIHKRDEHLKFKKEQLSSSTTNQSGRPCKPYPFHRHHDACRYKVNSVLDVTESGASDYIEPCHEYKGYIHMSEAAVESKMNKFTDEVIRFAAACMNSRTNGTIHFGVGDKPDFVHGQVLGVSVLDKEAYVNALPQAIEGHFEYKHIQTAKMCIKPPRFVEVLNPDMTSSEKYVIEVDIVPDFVICQENIYHVFSLDTRKSKRKSKSKETEKEEKKLFFIRDHSSSRDLLALTTFAKPMEEYNRFVDNVSQLSQLRKQAEENRLRVVVKLLMYETTEQSSRIPVLLMLDDFEEMDDVYDLQQLIEKECVKKDIGSRSPQVILLNCMRAESWEKTESTEDTVFIGNNLSEMEQRQFEKKLEEIEKTYKNADTFYAFMIMKKNFSPEYIQGVARLKSFNINHKHAQLIAVLVLLNVYCKGATLSVSLCEEFLGLQTKPHSGSSDVKAGFGKFSTLVTCCTEEAKVVFEAVRMIHSSMAVYCLQELTTNSVTKAEITDLLLTTDKLYECVQGKDKLMKDVHTMLVKRRHSVKGEDSQFSPLIQDIAKETPGVEENVLFNAAKRFEKDAIISQLFARYQYLKKRDFREAKTWAKNAKDLSRDNSYISDTSAQVIKHELKCAIQSDKEGTMKPEKLKAYLRMAQSATEAFRDTQEIAKKEATLRVQNKRDNSPFNTAGCLGEIQVAVIIIEILGKSPVFSAGNVRHDILSEVLSGRITIQDVARNDSRHHKHASYYGILREFEDLLYNLRHNMKRHFDFLDSFHVNLGSRFTLKDSREERTRQELFRCFQLYSDLFCMMDSTELIKNKNLSIMLQIHKARQFLEMRKADTYSGILNCLSNGTQTDMMVKTVRQYDFILSKNPVRSVREIVNFIYANVVLSCVKPESQFLRPYQTLIDLLCQVLQGQIPYGETLALHFIAVALLWPQQIFVSQTVESQKLGSYVSQMRTSFWNEMKSVLNGKSPVVHFLLGKKQGYDRLIHLGELERCVSPQENFASLWENGKIWKHERVKELLCRVIGWVQRKLILTDTWSTGSTIEVIPMFKSQLCGKLEGEKVSFVIGFSMKGPLAYDIY